MVAVLAIGWSLAAPGSVLAQSAGDEQYRDPFAGTPEHPSDQQVPDDSGNAGQDAAPAPQPAPTQAPQPVPESSVAEQVPAEQVPTEELPRTGAPVVLLVAAGVLLVGVGTSLRRLT